MNDEQRIIELNNYLTSLTTYFTARPNNIPVEKKINEVIHELDSLLMPVPLPNPKPAFHDPSYNPNHAIATIDDWVNKKYKRRLHMSFANGSIDYEDIESDTMDGIYRVIDEIVKQLNPVGHRITTI